jgi:2-polyprenyl-6-methoxyphenol hydroxylase-like FAD-dependent oxidoreductase
LYSVLLADLIRDELVHEGKRFTHYSFKQSNEDKNNKEQVVAHFDDGSEIAADILIGADGIQSGVREQVLLTPVISPLAHAFLFDRCSPTPS